jgi:hypothetical protein
VATGRSALKYHSGGVEVVFLRVGEDPVQSASAILDRSRSQRRLSKTILDIHGSESHLKEGRDFKGALFLRARDPAATMDDDNHRRRLRLTGWLIDVELGVVVVRNAIDDVGMHFVAEQLGCERRCVVLRQAQ